MLWTNKIDLQSFWGYDNELKLWFGYSQFAHSCMAGIKSLMDGKTRREAKANMLNHQNNDIAEHETRYAEPPLSDMLLDNREVLVICGEDQLKLLGIK